MEQQEFSAELEADDRGHVRIRLPFQPPELWGKKPRHYVRGTLNGVPFEGSLGSRGATWYFPVNKALQRTVGVDAGGSVDVLIAPGESPAAELPGDLSAALDAEPAAKSFFLGLSGFYQRQYVGWIEGAKKAETRQARVSEVVQLLKQERKQR
jgi:hypothetical protein